MDWPYPLIILAGIVGLFFLLLSLLDLGSVKEWLARHGLRGAAGTDLRP